MCLFLVTLLQTAHTLAPLVWWVYKLCRKLSENQMWSNLKLSVKLREFDMVTGGRAINQMPSANTCLYGVIIYFKRPNCLWGMHKSHFYIARLGWTRQAEWSKLASNCIKSITKCDKLEQIPSSPPSPSLCRSFYNQLTAMTHFCKLTTSAAAAAVASAASCHTPCPKKLLHAANL